MQNSLSEQMRAYCARIGKDPLLVQAAGGNVSWKEGDVLWVKASGTSLAAAEKADIFVPVDLANLRDAFSRQDFDCTPKVLASSGRPSIETALHALLPHRIVVHLHAIEMLALLVRADCKQLLQQICPQPCPWEMVAYHKPGAALACAVNDVLVRSPHVQMLFLKNHGIVLGVDNLEEIDTILNQWIQIIGRDNYHSSPKNPTLPTVPKWATGHFVAASDLALHLLATDPALLEHVRRHWALYPDHVVFLGPQACTYDSWDECQEHLSGQKTMPELIFIDGIGTFTSPSIRADRLEQLRCYYDVVMQIPPLATIDTLDSNQAKELICWDAEKYRLSLPPAS